MDSTVSKLRNNFPTPDKALQNCGKVSEVRMEYCKVAWLNPMFGRPVTNLHG
ncbi:MAG TPA: hypothetical protein VI413_06530 [Paludibacter sp.]